MSVHKFARSFKTRNDYMENPFSLKEFEEIRRLCDLEEERLLKVIKNTMAFCGAILLIVVIGDAIDSPSLKAFGMLLFILSIIILIPASFSLGPYAKVRIEGVTFKSFDHLGKHKTQSDDRFYPIIINENIYLPGTNHHAFIEKIRAMGRPLMRFEQDILNSIDC